ncbi:hypothetical protein M758_3G228400 [Ceratodon purpureus]|nr:hypothetical protein M758_3G228400 [Ceratodon purpureus]
MPTGEGIGEIFAASETSCKVCDSIDFGAAGFYYGYGITIGHEVSIDEIRQNSGQCSFCGTVAQFFSDWIHQKFDKQAPDLENAQAFVETYRLDSLELNDEGDPKGCLIRINVRFVVKKPAPSHDWFGPSLRFQKCSQDPLKVTDICDRDSLFDWESGEEEAYSGRIRPLVADTRLFRKWKESCCAIHGDHCKLIFTGRRLRRLRFIDVENRCLVDNEDDNSYTALSYVWGNAKLPQLTQSTDKRFREPGSLSTEMLPPTIDDAIEVTRSLGEKYIWVDCLCIMQDNEADKLELIPHMDSIFGFASVTIVAASGVNADVGLPGIRPKSRTREQVLFRIKGASLLATLDPEGSEEIISYLGESVWLTRGWTFQEKIFARRALIFTKEQVYWECQKASWCEDGLWETTKSPTLYRHCLGEEDFRHPWSSDVDSFERIYRKLVEVYSVRKLTYEKDGLDAFAGILQHFEKQAGQNFLWALPASLLSTAIMWPCELSATRRLDSCTLRSEDGTVTRCPFPSWSWVGWVGEVVFVALFLGNLKSETVDLIFYHLDGSGLPRIIVQAAAATQSLSQISIRKDDDRTIVTPEDIPESVLTRSIARNILFFWSSAAILHVRHEVDKPSLSCKGKVVPSLWSHEPLSHPGHEEEAEFVVIGRESPKRKEDRLALLLVSWENGVAYRRGLVRIKISDWVELGNRVWKMIILG